MKFCEFFINLFTVDGKYKVFSNVPNGVIHVETLDEFSMGFPKFIKKRKIWRGDIFFIRNIVVGDLDVVSLNLSPFNHVVIRDIDNLQKFKNIRMEIFTGLILY